MVLALKPWNSCSLKAWFELECSACLSVLPLCCCSAVIIPSSLTNHIKTELEKHLLQLQSLIATPLGVGDTSSALDQGTKQLEQLIKILLLFRGWCGCARARQRDEKNLSELALTACQKCSSAGCISLAKTTLPSSYIEATVQAAYRAGTERDLVNTWDFSIL